MAITKVHRYFVLPHILGRYRETWRAYNRWMAGNGPLPLEDDDGNTISYKLFRMDETPTGHRDMIAYGGGWMVDNKYLNEYRFGEENRIDMITEAQARQVARLTRVPEFEPRLPFP